MPRAMSEQEAVIPVTPVQMPNCQCCDDVIAQPKRRLRCARKSLPQICAIVTASGLRTAGHRGDRPILTTLGFAVRVIHQGHTLYSMHRNSANHVWAMERSRCGVHVQKGSCNAACLQTYLADTSQRSPVLLSQAPIQDANISICRSNDSLLSIFFYTFAEPASIQMLEAVGPLLHRPAYASNLL